MRKRSCKREQQLQLQNSPICLSPLIRKTTQENHSTGNLRDSLHSLLQGFSHIQWGIWSCIFTWNALIFLWNSSTELRACCCTEAGERVMWRSIGNALSLISYSICRVLRFSQMEMAEETEKTAGERKICPSIPNFMKQQWFFCLNGWRIKMIFPYSAYIF